MSPSPSRLQSPSHAPRAVLLATVSAAGLLWSASGVLADSILYGLGDSITFGEDDLVYEPSDGDRGYVGRFADFLAAQDGDRPEVRNFAIDGETASSFVTGTGRTPPVVGRTDDILALQNTNYDPGNILTQSEQFSRSVAAELAAGNDVAAVTVTLGFNELAALASLPPAEALAQIPATLAAYQASVRGVLAQVRGLVPDAPLFLLGYFNPFPGDPGDNPAEPIFSAAGDDLNAIIASLADEFGASFVDVAPAFVGNEAEFTFIDEQPAGFVLTEGPFGGLEPIGNVHPNAAGYDAIAAALIAEAAPAPVPLPATLPLYLAAVAGAGLMLHRRRLA